MQIHLFGNPAILGRTRGFASPDYSGFARSENDSLVVKKIFNIHSNEKQIFFVADRNFHDVPLGRGIYYLGIYVASRGR